MRLATYRDRSGTLASGVADGDRIRPFRSGLTLEAYIAMDEGARAAARGDLNTAVNIADVELLAPLRPKKNIFCVGRNYKAHAEEGARARGVELKLPDVPTFFTKAPTAIADPGAALHLDPQLSTDYDWEAELAIVIGKRCKDVSEADAHSVIFGYTCLNDVTARDLQRKHLQWFKGKTLDETCPIGPWIVEAGDVGDVQALDVTLNLNGVQKQHANTASMIFSIATIIQQLSAGMTLEPGDIIATGTPEGVGFARTPPEFLQDGDVMEIIIENVGTLINSVKLSAPVGASR